MNELKHFHKTIHGRLVTIAFVYDEECAYNLFAGIAIQNPIDNPDKKLGEKIAYNRAKTQKMSDHKAICVGFFIDRCFLNKFVLKQLADTLFIKFENYPQDFIANWKNENKSSATK